MRNMQPIRQQYQQPSQNPYMEMREMQERHRRESLEMEQKARQQYTQQIQNLQSMNPYVAQYQQPMYQQPIQQTQQVEVQQEQVQQEAAPQGMSATLQQLSVLGEIRTLMTEIRDSLKGANVVQEVSVTEEKSETVAEPDKETKTVSKTKK